MCHRTVTRPAELAASAYGRSVPRTPRSYLPDGKFHVTIRGNRRQPMFVIDRDATAYLDIVDYVTEKVGWTVYAYCLMPNHVHLVLEAEREVMSTGMRYVNGVYAQRFNRVHGFRGPLQQGRFNSKVIRDDAHLWEAIRYVVLNPVRAGVCGRPEQWPWSSYRACLGLEPARRFLAVDKVLALFEADRVAAREAFREYVEQAISPPPTLAALDTSWGQSRGQSLFEARLPPDYPNP